MAWGFLKIYSLFVGSLSWVTVASEESLGVTNCDTAHDGTTCHSSLLENQEERESATAKLELLQTTRHKKVLAHTSGSEDDIKGVSKEAESDHALKQETLANESASDQNNSVSDLISKDHNGKMCMLCGKPLADRADREYHEFRTDCGGLSSVTGPNASTLSIPVSKFTAISETGAVSNGFCQLNFAKSCVDAIANKDYLYFAKSIDLKAPGSYENAAWDGRYCRLNGFLEPGLVALQHNFTAAQAKAGELCKTKYAKKYKLDTLTFKDMMSAARYDDKSAPTFDEAEILAAWNCAMGDLGCDMALCAYSFCKKDSETGLYDECKGWHPIHGMPSAL